MFAAAKAAALKWLNACPDKVICQFINRSWRFMDAYQQGLTGEAAAWAVCKQKGHCAVLETAMQAFKASLNGKGKQVSGSQ
jgi:hypothetical protein